MQEFVLSKFHKMMCCRMQDSQAWNMAGAFVCPETR
jgi:hypothetical protein